MRNEDERRRLKEASERNTELRFPVDIMSQLNEHELLRHTVAMSNTVINRWKADFNRVVGQMTTEIEELEEDIKILREGITPE